MAGGMRQAEVATTFRVSISTIQRLIARRRRDTTDDRTAMIPAGRHRSITPAQHATLWTQLEANRDATIETHTRVWNEAHGTSVSPWTMGRAIRRVGWTRKKRRWERPSVMSMLERSSTTK